MITLEDGEEYAHIHTFKNRHHLPSVREHFLGFVWIKTRVYGHMSSHKNTANVLFFWGGSIGK